MDVVVGTSGGAFVVDGSTAAASGLRDGIVRQVIRVGDALLAGASDGVYRSSDGGRSWTRTGVDAGEVWNVGAPGDGLVYAGTQPAHLFVSSDGGGSWREVASFLSAPGAERWCVPNSPLGARALALAFDPFDPRHMWVGVEVGGVVASRDGGQTWSVTVPCGNADIHLLAPHPTQRGVLFATTGFGRNDDKPMDPSMAGPYRSEDGGATWRFLGAGMGPHYTRAMCLDTRAPYALTVPAVPDVRSSIRDAGGAQSVLYQSLDGGEKWRSLGDAAHSPSEARMTAVAVDPSTASGVLVGTETGEVWRVSPSGDWLLLCSELPAVQALLAA